MGIFRQQIREVHYLAWSPPSDAFFMRCEVTSNAAPDKKFVMAHLKASGINAGICDRVTHFLGAASNLVKAQKRD
ncbi:hypothetical protein AO073_11110 [Pseudomonas syringae ICMP 11293]|nr:hypothetical protein AO073_11110 [Pseudomonas syringae ICMP 11293]